MIHLVDHLEKHLIVGGKERNRFAKQECSVGYNFKTLELAGLE